jgi:nitroreductase
MMKDLVKSFVEVSLRRKSVRSLNNRPISNEILAQLLTISQLAPSSFNLQPYKFIIAQSNDSQRALASAMLGNNENVVNEASVSIIFLGDRG